MEHRDLSENFETADGWVLVRRIGAGAYGEVWEAHRQGVSLHRALKLVPIERPRDYRGWEQEIHWLEGLDHPSIVRFHDSGLITTGPRAGQAWIATELCQRSLAEELHQAHEGRLSPTQCEPIVEAVLRALVAAEAHKCVHRDIKPGNILLSSRGAWKLADFGTSRLLPEGLDRPQSTLVVGTPEFMSKYAFQGRQDHAADRYALGVTAHLILTGRTIHPWPPGMDVLEYRKRVDATPPEIGEEVPDRWRRIIEMLIGELEAELGLAHSRTPNADALSWYLDHAGQGRRAHVTAETISKAENSPRTRPHVTQPTEVAPTTASRRHRPPPARTPRTTEHPVGSSRMTLAQTLTALGVGVAVVLAVFLMVRLAR